MSQRRKSVSHSFLIPICADAGITSLYLDGCPVTDAGLAHLNDLKDLTSFDATSTPCVVTEQDAFLSDLLFEHLEFG